MIAVIVDNNPEDLKILHDVLLEIHPDIEIIAFVDPLLAFKFGVTNHIDSLYTAVLMKRLGGFKLEKMMREDNPDISVNFIADDDTYKAKAIQHLANSYTVKPITADKLAAAESEDW